MKKCPICNKKYRDTDYYCLADNYRLVQCDDEELTDEEKFIDKRNGEKYNNPNKHGNFATSVNNHTPHCPICNSSHLIKISKTNKIGSMIFFGIFSVGHVNKTFKCENCGMKF